MHGISQFPEIFLSMASPPALSTPQRVPVAGDASQSESLSPEVAGRAKLLRFDLTMDLCLPRRNRLNPNLFSRDSPDRMEIADELGQEEQFQGITKKVVRDRLLRLREQHKAKYN